MYVTLITSFIVICVLILFKVEQKRKPSLTAYQFMHNVGKNNDLLRNVYIGIISGILNSKEIREEKESETERRQKKKHKRKTKSKTKIKTIQKHVKFVEFMKLYFI